MAFYKENIVDINLNTGNIFRSFLNHSIGYKDDDADRFGIRAFRDGEPVDLSGASCQAIFMNPNGTNIALTSYGTVSGNVAYVTLPPACYDYEGQFCLAIKLVGGGVTGTVRIVDGMVINTGASGTVSPTSAVPTYQEILSTYDAMVAATSAANLAIAETFDATKAYPAGKYVINEGHLYRLTADHAANVTWANTSKVATNFGDDLSSLKSAVLLNATQIERTGSDRSVLPACWVHGYLDTNGIIQNHSNYISTENFITFDEDTTIYFKSGYSYTICEYNKITHAFSTRTSGSVIFNNVSKDKAYRITIYNGQEITSANIADYAFSATYRGYLNNYAYNVNSKFDEVVSDIIDSNVIYCRKIIEFEAVSTYFGKTLYKGLASASDVFSIYIGSTSGTSDTNIAYMYFYDESGTRLGTTSATVGTLVTATAPPSTHSVEFKIFASLGTALPAGSICVFNDVYFIKGNQKKIKINKDVEITELRNHLYISNYTGTDNERLANIISDAIALKSATVFIDDKLYITEGIDIEMQPGINIVIDGFIDALNFNSVCTYSTGATWTEPKYGLVCNVPKADPDDPDSEAIVFDVHSDIETTGFRVQNLCCFNNTERDPSDNYRFTNHDMILFKDENVRAEFVNVTAYGFYYFCKSPGLDRNGNYNVQDSMLFDKIHHISCGHGIELRHADASIVRQYLYTGHSGYERMLLITTSQAVSVSNCEIGYVHVYGSVVAVPGEHADNAIAIYDSTVDINGFHQERNQFYTAIQVSDNASNVFIHNSNSVNPVRNSYFLIAGNGANVQISECDIDTNLRCYVSAGATVHLGNNTKANILLTGTAGKVTNNVSLVRVDLSTGKITMAGQEINTQATISNNTVTLPYKCKFAISTAGVATLTNDGYPTVGYEEGTEFVDFILI